MIAVTHMRGPADPDGGLTGRIWVCTPVSGQSGRADSNRRLLAPKASALTKLSYVPLLSSDDMGTWTPRHRR